MRYISHKLATHLALSPIFAIGRWPATPKSAAEPLLAGAGASPGYQSEAPLWQRWFAPVPVFERRVHHIFFKPDFQAMKMG